MTAAVALLGIDLGTTRIKAGLIAADGTPLGVGRAELETRVEPAIGLAEQDPEAWWDGLGNAVEEALAGAERIAGARPAPAAICVVGHGPSCTPPDADRTR